MTRFIQIIILVGLTVFALNVMSNVPDKPKDFIANKQILSGMIDIMHEPATDSVFLRLDKQQLSNTYIFQSSLPQGIGSNDIGLDRGQLGDTRLVKFERFGNKLLLNQLNTDYRAVTDNVAERKSIDEAFASSVIAGFEIVNETPTTVSINYTAFLLSDIHGIVDRLERIGQGAYSLDTARSGIYLPRTKAFTNNIELEALVTFGGSPKGQFIKDVTPDPKSVSVHLHHSFIALPDDNYQTRQFHPFSGYWKHSFMDYSVPIEADMEQAFIPRHRLAKKDPRAARSEAVEPIIYYLDPGIPEPVLSALKEGAMWWNEAFEAAGYINAFQVKVLPDGADPMDVNYNVIQWVHRATRGWSYGSSVIDPRTGEIIKGHVTLGSLRVRQDFLIATGFTAPYTSSSANELDDTSKELTLALDRIKQLSAHEVGHTLGIAHNFAASENDRASVMDYPHPLIELTNGKIDISTAYASGIGDWDKYVIAYGYQDFADKQEEPAALLALVKNAIDTGFLYKSDPDARISKRASANGHLWDNGKNAIAEFKRVSEVREFALNQFGSDNLPFNGNYSDLERRLVPVYYSHRYQLDALVKQISGVNYRYSVKQDQQAANVSFVDGKQQERALGLIIQSATADYLRLPQDLIAQIPPKAYGSQRTRESMPSRMGIAFDPITAAESISAHTLAILLQAERLNRLGFQHAMYTDIPSVTKVSTLVFNRLIKNNDPDRLSQRIKMVALSVFFDALANDELSPDAKLEMQNVLIDYQKWLKKYDDKLANRVLLKHVEHYWQHDKWPMAVVLKPMPPGSPI
ncbi:hypothetical protein GPUN_0681 [Glaciecola punicea ACAM 611]|uniref:Extracellular metal-dependent peptidase n=2 Tax=Glaciecola TaxID=89404 RepID=H5T944_9ALTE|nr:zinc-dependent metalloprotease [Glaciecola punicea]GAB54821.1 hypothetical protein GPUN_0681 [Glaciecola punicea ACAM 611]